MACCSARHCPFSDKLIQQRLPHTFTTQRLRPNIPSSCSKTPVVSITTNAAATLSISTTVSTNHPTIHLAQHTTVSAVQRCCQVKRTVALSTRLHGMLTVLQTTTVPSLSISRRGHLCIGSGEHSTQINKC